MSCSFIPSSDDPGSWDPGTMEPSICSSENLTLPTKKRLNQKLLMFRPCSEGADIVFHLCRWDHLCRKGTDDLFDIGSSIIVMKNGVTNAPVMNFEIVNSTHGWSNNTSRSSLNCTSYERWPHFVCIKAGTTQETKIGKSGGRVNTDTFDVSSTQKSGSNRTGLWTEQNKNQNGCWQHSNNTSSTSPVARCCVKGRWNIQSVWTLKPNTHSLNPLGDSQHHVLCVCVGALVRPTKRSLNIPTCWHGWRCVLWVLVSTQQQHLHHNDKRPPVGSTTTTPHNETTTPIPTLVNVLAK